MKKKYPKILFQKGIPIVLIFTLLISVLGIGNVSYAANTFKDIEKSYAKKEIEELAEKGIIGGMGDEMFKPYDTVTRAQLAKILAYLLGLEEDPIRK